MTTTVATLKAVFTADTANFDKGKRKVESGLSNLGASISNLGDSMSGMGRSMLSFAAPMTAALGGAVYAAMDFDEQLRNIQAVTGQSTGEIDALGQSILDMNTRFSSTELATTFYDIAGGVTDASARMDVFNAAIHVAQAGNAGLQGTTQALIATMNAYADANLSAADAGDILTRTVGMGVGTMDQFAAALPNVIGIASSVGISFEEIAAATAYLTTKGNSASEATTQLSAAISALLTPNAAMTEAFKMAGIESGSLALSSEGLMGTLNLLKDSFGGNVDEMAKAFGSVEALRAVVSLAGGDVDEFFTTFSEGVEGATASAEQIQMESAAAQFDLLKSSLQDVAIQIGLALLPALNRITRALLPVVTKFTQWTAKNPRLTTSIAAIAFGVTALGGALTVLGAVLGPIVVAFGLLLSPIGLVAAALVGLGAAFYWLYDNNVLGFRDGLIDTTEALQQFATTALDTVRSVMSLASALDVNMLVNGAISMATTFWNNFKTTVLGLIPSGVTAIRDRIVSEASNLFAGGLGIDFSKLFDFSVIDITSLAGVLTIFGRLRTAVSLFSTGIGLLAPIFSMLISPIGLASLAVVGLGAALYIAYSQNIFGFKDAIDKQLVPALQRGGTEALKFVANIVAAFTTGGLSNAAQSIVTGLTNGANQATVAAKGYGPAIATGLSGGMSAAGPQISAGLGVIGQKVDEQSPIIAEKGGVMSGQLTGQFITGLITYAPSILLGLVAFSAIVMKYLTIDLPTAVLGWMADVTVAFGKGFIAGIIMEGPSIIAAFGGLGNDILAAVSSGLNSIIVKAEEVLAKLGLVKQAQADVSSSSGTVTTDNSGNTTITVTTHPQGRALGGSVSGGTPYIVGEVGPELFVPKSSGTIIPNHALASSGGASSGGASSGVTINGGTFILQGIQNVQQLYEELARLNKQRGSNAAFAKAG